MRRKWCRRRVDRAVRVASRSELRARRRVDGVAGDSVVRLHAAKLVRPARSDAGRAVRSAAVARARHRAAARGISARRCACRGLAIAVRCLRIRRGGGVVRCVGGCFPCRCVVRREREIGDGLARDESHGKTRGGDRACESHRQNVPLTVNAAPAGPCTDSTGATPIDARCGAPLPVDDVEDDGSALTMR